ncbi:MAG: hypothetical protein DRO39_02420 [Thermoprotei archaeon]|nr:MAG: hypothetical protein DRO39_02420 [Thermoprotei archaeon]
MIGGYVLRGLVTFLVWALILELITLIYLASTERVVSVEGAVTLVLTVATALALALAIRLVRKELS